jgi:TRAP-type mannitol/chloroaromatic compound transport system permease small subunit
MATELGTMELQQHTTPAICRRLDNFITRIGKTVCWLNVLLVIVILVQVTLRYGLGVSVVALEELQWHLYGLLIMFGLSYDVIVDGHIRLDLLHSRFSRRKKETIEFLGILFLLFPMTIIIFLHGLDFVAGSYRVGETSESPLGLPYRWIFKGVIPVSMFLLGVAAFTRMIRAAAFVITARKTGNTDAG